MLTELLHLGSHRQITAYLDDVFILSSDNTALKEIKAFLASKSHVLKFNEDKCSIQSLRDIRENQFRPLGTMIESTVKRRTFLQCQ